MPMSQAMTFIKLPCTSLECNCLSFHYFSLIGHKISVSCGPVSLFSPTSGCLCNCWLTNEVAILLAITTPALTFTVTLIQKSLSLPLLLLSLSTDMGQVHQHLSDKFVMYILLERCCVFSQFWVQGSWSISHCVLKQVL